MLGNKIVQLSQNILKQQAKIHIKRRSQLNFDSCSNEVSVNNQAKQAK